MRGQTSTTSGPSAMDRRSPPRCPTDQPSPARSSLQSILSPRQFAAEVAAPLVIRSSQARVHWFALEREHSEDALVNAVERFARDEPFECFDAECELAEREGSLVAEPT